MSMSIYLARGNGHGKSRGMETNKTQTVAEMTESQFTAIAMGAGRETMMARLGKFSPHGRAAAESMADAEIASVLWSLYLISNAKR